VAWTSMRSSTCPPTTSSSCSPRAHGGGNYCTLSWWCHCFGFGL
jgi:hypothetical protein